MAFDEGLAAQMRDDIGPLDGLTERRMFGGLCFQLNGHMVCGVHKGGGMFRVGKPRYEAALAMAGVDKLSFTGRPMGGMVEVSDAVMADDALRLPLIAMALENARSLPPK